jgi:hypothetical protein
MTVGGFTMMLKDEFLLFWILCLVVITFAARNFWGGMVYLAQHAAAFSIAYLPSLFHLLINHLC